MVADTLRNWLGLCLFAVGYSMFSSMVSGAADIVAEPFPPAKFSSLYIERDNKGTTTSIQSTGDAVTYQVTTGGKIVESKMTHPGGDDWFAFIQALNAAKVYQWAPKYYYPGQGETWVVDLTMDDRKFSSGGTNDFPLNGNVAKPQANPASGPSVPFQLFWAAALQLAGQAKPNPPTSP